MKNLNVTTEQAKAINDNHIYALDKSDRIDDGASSSLICVRNGFVLLEVEIHAGWQKTNEVTAGQFIDAWKHNNPELNNIGCWEVRIYKNGRIAGDTVSRDEMESLHGKIDIANAISERYPEYIYRACTEGIKRPMITLKDSGHKFNLEFGIRSEYLNCGFFNLKDPVNYSIHNSNASGNLFIVPHTEDDYLLITEAADGNMPEMKYLRASITPVTYSVHSKLIYLINLSKQESVKLFWRDKLTQQSGFNAVIEVKNL